MFNLLYDPTLTSLQDYLKNHSFDYMDFVGNVTSQPQSPYHKNGDIDKENYSYHSHCESYVKL